MNRYLDVAPEVQQAVAEGRPVVALESTIISHGMPYPQNVETALNVENIIRENGAVPATIAIIGGRLKAGLTPQEIDYLGKSGHAVTKASRRDLPILVAEGRDGATTVTTTMMIAHMAGLMVVSASQARAPAPTAQRAVSARESPRTIRAARAAATASPPPVALATVHRAQGTHAVSPDRSAA